MKKSYFFPWAERRADTGFQNSEDFLKIGFRREAYTKIDFQKIFKTFRYIGSNCTPYRIDKIDIKNRIDRIRRVDRINK